MSVAFRSAKVALHHSFAERKTTIKNRRRCLENLDNHAPLLRKLAEATGRKYLDEDCDHELPDQLAMLNGGEFIAADYSLWQSYSWFTAIACLLTLEWWLRKRANLI